MTQLIKSFHPLFYFYSINNKTSIFSTVLVICQCFDIYPSNAQFYILKPQYLFYKSRNRLLSFITLI